MRNAGDLTTTAEKLQDAFTSIWSNLASNIPDELPTRQRVSPPSLPSIGQVKSVLKQLNPKKSTGNDGIPAWLLKKFHEELAVAVHDIVSASIEQSTYPKQYKHALVSPVAKVPHPTCINSDYRQISVLPQMAKVLERVQLQLNSKDFGIRQNQHAFIENRSTVSALADITQSWFDSTDNTRAGRKGVHVLFLDFSKAFDRVDHGTLLAKLALTNISIDFWEWIRSFLSDRTQQVRLPGTTSRIAACPAGVPQGSVISPSLFSVIVNDLEDAIPHDIRDSIGVCKYADDCTLYEAVSATHSSKMQMVLDSIQSWSYNNKMVLNSTKTKEMWISFRDVPSPDYLKIENRPLDRVNSFKLLGVFCQDDLKWNSHVQEVTKKANKRLFHLRECRKAALPMEVGITMYCSRIRPRLEYASPIWSGIPSYLENEIDHVQKRSLSIIGAPKNTLKKLSVRRDLATKRELERILSDELHPCYKHVPPYNKYKYNLRSKRRLNPPLSGTERHQNSFIPRAINLINE